MFSSKDLNKFKLPKILKQDEVKKKELEEKRLKQREERELLKMQAERIKQLEEDWQEIMYQTNTVNEYNHTFTFDNIKYEKYGFSAIMYCPKGLSFKQIETLIDKIEDGLHCIFIYEKERLDKSLKVRIVTQINMDKRYSPPKTEPWEIYIGDRFDGSPIIVDLNSWCQVLVSGTTGGGKSKLLDCILATQVYNHRPDNLELYLIQLDKCDLLLYRDSTVCMGFANTLDKTIVVLEHLMKELEKRNHLVEKVKSKGMGSNITDYNRIYKNDKQSTIIVALDEMASIAEKSSDNATTKAKKQAIDDMLSAVAQYGRSNNVFLISCLQRPTAQLLNTFIKSMSNLKISFRQSNMKSSEVAMDDGRIALDLARRVAVYKLLSYDFLQTPYIDDPLIMSFIKKKLQPGHFDIFDKKIYADRLKELQSMSGDKTKSKDKSDKSEPKETGKEDISYEQSLKKKEEELLKIKQEIEKNQAKMERQLAALNKKAEEVKKIEEVKNKELYSKVDPTIQQKIIENIKSIPNFVPYQPINPNIIIIDQTQIDLSKTSKPIRSGKEKIKE